MTTGSIGGGFDTNVTEIIDLENPGSTCDDYLPYPNENGASGAVGGLLANGKPLICGGFHDHPEKCFYLGNSSIQAETGQSRFLSQALVSSDGSSLWLTGGISSVSTEYVIPGQDQDGPNFGPDLPYDSDQIYGHCLVQLDAETYMALGGRSDEGDHSETFLIHVGNQSFTEIGPQLTGTNAYMSCAVIKTQDSFEGKIVVVAGGELDGEDTNTIQTWIVGSTTTDFRTLNVTLPRNWLKDAATVVTSDQKNMLIVGGFSGFDHYEDAVIKISCTSSMECQVEEMEQKLRIPRGDHVAMLVPDDLVTCH